MKIEKKFTIDLDEVAEILERKYNITLKFLSFDNVSRCLIGDIIEN